MFSPGRYKFGVRAHGSTKKLHSVITEADFFAVIMDAPVVTAMSQSPAVAVSGKIQVNN